MLLASLHARCCALIVLLALSLFTARSQAAIDPKTPLPLDPAIHIGTLDNGLTYWIREHATPPGKVSFWLHVASGSVNEADGQEGIAHFLEHLAFNGTTHFPPGELVKFFESIGLRFGQHQNAFTGFNQTTYTLTLPNTEADTIDKGLLYLSDVAFGMLLTPEEIDKERNVILEERRARKGVRQRLTEQIFPELLPGSRAAQRLPIGLESTIARVQRDDFKAYYDKWYHPGKVTILAVGDAPVETIRTAINKHFGNWQRSEPVPEDLSYGVKPYEASRAIVITDPELTTASVETLAIGPRRMLVTVGDYRERIVHRLGTWIVNRRLQQLVQEGKAPFQSARVSVSSLFGVATQRGAEADAEPAAWPEALSSLLVEVERARRYGFTPQELDNAKTAFLTNIEHAAQTESTRDARFFLRMMNRALSNEERPRSAAQSLELQKQLLPDITLQEVADAFATAFAPGPKAALVTLPERDDVSVPSKAQVLSLVDAAMAKEIEPWQGAERISALLENRPEPGAIAERSHDDILDITSVTFDNNVRLHYRFMDFKKDNVMVTISLAGGKIRETEANRGITSLATQPLIQPATSRFSSTALRDYMTGKKVSVSAQHTPDTVRFTVSGTPEALEDGLQLTYLLLHEATIEPASVALWEQQLLQSIEARRTRVNALTREASRLLLSGNDPRMRAVTSEQVKARAKDIPQAQAWLDRLLQTAPIEVAIVGDMPEDRALALAATYLSSLPKRQRTDSSLTALRQVQGFTGPAERTVEVETITPRAQPILMWRSAPWSDVRGRRISYLMARILESRMREEIREKRGLTYSTSTYVRPARVYPAMSALHVQFTADPDKVEEAVRIARSVVETYAAEGPTDAEMQTVRTQMKNTIETMLQEPRFWVNLLANLDYHGTNLKNLHGLLDQVLAFTKADIVQALQQTVQPERFGVVIGQPKVPAAKQSQQPKTPREG
ncbi:M16 family metallopeptidase [Candidatus Entotheonella palauensis]|uniref:M16 family metallopeptidase n=1 Tax=Candidatus Entotheonella palauensis TaxID=93172 RepID=UPI000B7F8741|nr:M16 family metallopeptidase [Candidatus Entotheonella palauensis]